MSLGSYFEGALEKTIDKSFLMRVIRNSTKKAVILGVMDAMQNENSLDTDPAEKTVVGVNGVGTKPEMSSSSPIALPRPQLIGIGPKKVADEPDQPGVPPKRIRMKRKGANENEQPSDTPEPNHGELNGDGQ